MSYNLGGTKWGDPVEGSGGGQVTWSFASWSNFDQIYDFDYSISDSTYQSLVRAAFQMWESVANIDFVEIADGIESDIRLGWDYIDGAYGTVGEAGWFYSGATISYGEIRFDTSETWSSDKTSQGGINFYAVALHEIGHAIGLTHADPSGPPSIMTPIISEDDLTNYDLAAINALYGSGQLGTNGSDTFQGSIHDDLYDGKGGDDFIVGGRGDDILYGGAGNDQIWAGAGDTGTDEIFGDAGNDILAGGAGNDTVFGGDGSDTIFGGSGNDNLSGDAGSDTIWGGDGQDSIMGGDGNDVLGGGNLADIIFGGLGVDIVYAGRDDSSDTVDGGAGDDTLFGGGGADTLIGGSGNDQMYGGGGNDTFIFEDNHGDDSIGGFESLGDNILDLSALSGLTSFDDLSVTQSGANTVIDTGQGTITLFNTTASNFTVEDVLL
jgi:Ca2+-binding RTX toxin-like protein